MNTPIVFIIFKRPDTTKRVFEAIRQAKPSTLFVIADGPRGDREGEVEKCAAARAIVEQVDWHCEVIKNYSEVNLGCARRVASGLNWVFEQVEEAIILEDDCVPHSTFFRFCEELLERYRFDKRVNSISAQNFATGNLNSQYSYHFSRYPLCWGWATWKRAWQHFDYEMQLWQEVKDKNILRDILLDSKAIETWNKLFQSTYNLQIDTWDTRWVLACWLQNSLSIHPALNLVTNIGFNADATHTVEKRQFSSFASEEMEFPLLHPPYVVRAVAADNYTQAKVYNMSYLQRAGWKTKKIFKFYLDALKLKI
ncbi:MAG: glycosyltransferase family 2 protein [Myxacorys chilensis ATA2-1-KO14]|jgi:hypothetical protein|nr:glycosyltransferase family 2 protein [Myxacorys chilensis ATA2-1-KO14]